MVNICLLSHGICRSDKRGGLSLFRQVRQTCHVAGNAAIRFGSASTPQKSDYKTHPTCGFLTPPLRTKLTHHSRNIMAMSPPPTNRASRQQLALQHTALLVHDMQEYFITAYDRNVNPMHAALSNIQSSISPNPVSPSPRLGWLKNSTRFLMRTSICMMSFR